MKILVISSYVPYPLHSGGQVRLFNLIRELSGKHEITLIAEKRSKQVLGNISELEKICKKLIVVPSSKQWSLKNILKTVTSTHSFLFTGHTNKLLRKKIKNELESNTFDLIHVETFYVMQNLPESSLPIVLAEHNIEYMVYQRYMDRAGLLRTLLAIDIAKIRREEESAWKKATVLIAVSEEDKKIMELAGFLPVIVANGVNIDQFTMKNTDNSFSGKVKKILFIGDFKWIQNQDTATWIIKEIWPQISAKFQLKLWVVGRSIPESIRNLTDDPEVLFDEKNSGRPAHELFQEASVLLAPIRVGGGTSYKILESMSCGTPVVTMPLSASAISATDGKELLVGTTPAELAEKTLRILQDKELYETISRNARKLIEENYTWKSIAKELEKAYKKVLSFK